MALVPVLDDRYSQHMPEMLKPPQFEIAVLKDAIHIFMCLRHMVHHLKWRGGVDNMKDFPISTEERDVYMWREGECVIMD
jgi:hypothetical protein